MAGSGDDCIRVGQRPGDDQHRRPAPEETFARAAHRVSLLADSPEDLADAAQIIDRALRLRDERPAPEEKESVHDDLERLAQLLDREVGNDRGGTRR